ncbi:FAD-binding protein [Luteimonas sp. SJ-92]|uniref:FAD-binding protein n=1 Tax=Luteimonas salinisoli TaxID=2752307 RepID=A0A853JIW0_9GAMM|nr:FAD-linked oxidase C-terminal domain-containing protein [Luteimonas salinisoli]NZA28388.1 FAD-binding protein [Luteimonas salinisoli]
MPSLPAALETELAELLGEGWRSDAAILAAHGGDGSRHRAAPLGVATPADRAQVGALVRACRRHRVPLVARGGGTSSTGAALAGGAVAVSFARMDRILDIRTDDRIAIVEPGVRNGALQHALAAHGLFWPPDPASADDCTVGGNLACNAGGPRTVKYGASRDNVLGLAAVTGTGDIVTVGGATTKDATGYDLTHLIVGSEGTLALIVEATLKLAPLPEARASLRALYDDAAAAAAAVARIMAQPAAPSMLEFMDAACIRLAREVGGAEIAEAGALLLIEADGDAATLPHALDALERAARGAGLRAIERAADDAAGARLWAARKALSHAQRAIAPAKLNEDVVVPVSRIPALVDGIQALAREFDLPIIAFGHAGNGNLHANILYDPADAGQDARAHAALPRLFALALSLGGTLSGEHGIGTAKRGFMRDAFDAPTLAAMRAVKAALDPDGILNPGKVLPEA